MITLSIRNTFVALLLAILALAPMHTVLAETNTESNTSIFSNLHKRQIKNREKIKTNLLQILSSEENVSPATLEKDHQSTPVIDETPHYSVSELATITYQLADIADRLESRMLVLESQGAIIEKSAHTALDMVRVELESVTLQLTVLDTETVDTTTTLEQLAYIRTELQKIIAGLKSSLATE